MMFFLWACVGAEFAVPEATVFFEDQVWEGTLSFLRIEGDKEQCRMDYSLIEGNPPRIEFHRLAQPCALHPPVSSSRSPVNAAS